MGKYHHKIQMTIKAAHSLDGDDLNFYGGHGAYFLPYFWPNQNPLLPVVGSAPIPLLSLPKHVLVEQTGGTT